MAQESSTPTPRDLDYARELGTLAGEVRVLKWGAAIAIPAILGFLTILYQEINSVRREVIQQLTETQRQFTQQLAETQRRLNEGQTSFQSEITPKLDEIQRGQSDIRERLARVEGQLNAESRLETLVADMPPPGRDGDS